MSPRYPAPGGVGHVDPVPTPGPTRSYARCRVAHAAAVGDAPARDQPQRLHRHAPGHLGLAPHPLHEVDRHLGDPEAGPQRAHREVGLEDVAVRLDVLEADPLERGAAEEPVPGGGVADVDAEQQPHVAVAPAREPLPATRPVLHGPAGHPARADHEVGRVVGVSEAVDQPVQLLGLVGAVGVHLADHVVPGGERPREAGEVRRAQPLLAVAVQDRDGGVLGGQAFGDLPGPVRRAVVHDQDVHIRPGGAQAPDHPGEVVRLVVGRDHHHRAAARCGLHPAHPSPGARRRVRRCARR